MGMAMGDGHGRARAHLPAVVADRGLERLGVLRRPEVDGTVEAARDEELGVHGVPREGGHVALRLGEASRAARDSPRDLTDPSATVCSTISCLVRRLYADTFIRWAELPFAMLTD